MGQKVGTITGFIIIGILAGTVFYLTHLFLKEQDKIAQLQIPVPVAIQKTVEQNQNAINSVQQPTDMPASQPPISENQPNQITTPVNTKVHFHDTSKWFTYTNTKYGYSFKYPDTGWELYGSIGGNGFGNYVGTVTTEDQLKIADQVFIKTKCSSDHSHSIDVEPKNSGYGGVTVNNPDVTKNYEESNVTFLGLDADQAIYSYVSLSDGKKESDLKEISFDKGEYNYTIGGTEKDYQKICGDEGIVDDILSTFKFIN